MSSQPEEALPVLEATLALNLRYWSHDERAILCAQSSLASCRSDLGRDDEALVLRREIYTRRVVTLGVSHERTILSGCSLSISLNKLRLYTESKTFTRDQLLPEARRSLGADHDLTLRSSQTLAHALCDDPQRTRNGPCLNQNRRGITMLLISTQATTCSKPRPSCRTWSRGDGGSLVLRTRTRVPRRETCPSFAGSSPGRRFGVSAAVRQVCDRAPRTKLIETRPTPSAP